MRNRIVFVCTNWWRTERILPAIKKLSSTHDILILTLGSGNLESLTENRQALKIKKSIHDLIKDPSYTIWANRVDNKSNASVWWESDIDEVLKAVVENVTQIDCVIYDDSRSAGHQIPKIIFEPFYEAMKKRNIPIVSNIHGNVDDERLWKFVSLEQGKIYDKVCIYGDYDRNRLKSYNIDEHVLVTGIPSNDQIALEEKSDSHVLIVLNRVDFDGMKTDISIIENLQLNELWQRYKLPLIFKVKPPPRIIDANEVKSEERALVYLLQKMVAKNSESFDPSTPIIISEDEYEENWLLANSKCIISYGSTMCLKALQADKPIVIVREMGNVANFENYYGTMSVKEDFFDVFDSWDDKKEERRKFLQETLSGALEFNATEAYSKSIYGVIDEWKQKNTNQ